MYKKNDLAQSKCTNYAEESAHTEKYKINSSSVACITSFNHMLYTEIEVGIVVSEKTSKKGLSAAFSQWHNVRIANITLLKPHPAYVTQG